MLSQLFKLKDKYINLQLDSKSIYTRVLEQPGLWMPADELQKLVESLQEVVTRLNIGGLDYGVVQGSKEALDRSILTVIYDRKNDKPFAFNALAVMPCELRGKSINVIHLGLVVIDPSYRSKGLSWILYGLTTFLLFLKNKFQPLWISNVTQVPAIIGMVSESFGNVFPNPQTKSECSFDHIILARQILKLHRSVFGVGLDATFNEEHFVIENAYTGGSDNLKKTYLDAPKHRNEIYNSFCEQFLDYKRGDDFLQLGQMTVEAYYKYMIHNIPKSSLLVIFYKILFGAFEFTLVPIYQWFSVKKQNGNLRPRN